jgi:hypothetical protein
MIEQPANEVEQAQIDAVKQRIRRILSELKMLAKAADVTDEQFLSQIVGRTLESTGATGATIWQVCDDGEVAVVHEAGKTSSNSGLSEDQLTMHDRLVRTVASSGRPTLIEPAARDQASGEVINPLPCLLLLKPLNDPSLHRQFVIELYQRPEIAAAERTGYMRYLEEIGEIFGSWQARHQLRFQSTRQTRQQKLMDFVRDIHGSLDPREVAYAAANDGRLLADCDRLSILSFDGRRCKVLAVSGQDDFDNRSNVVRKQQNLASLVCRTQQPLWLIGHSEDLPRATRDLVDDYLNESHSRTLGVFPLFDGRGQADEDTGSEDEDPALPGGAMILEWFGQDVTEQEASEDVLVLSDHIGRALANANEYKSIFLMPLWRAIGKWKWLVSARTLPKTIAVGSAIAALLLFLTLFPWPFDMRVDGVLEPVEKQNVFAITRGVISRVHVDNGQMVKKGDLLVELRNDQLDYEMTAALGQLAVTRQEFNSASTTALMARQEQNRDQEELANARLTTLREKMNSLLRQIESLKAQEKQLRIYSPIDGTIVSWDPVRQLTERPVSPEDVVLVVAAVDSRWHMELFIPERKYGHVINAAANPQVTFFAATNPNRKYRGTIEKIEGHAAEHPAHGSSVRAFADIDPTDHPELYVGAAITARIHCGTRPVGYAWFHELFEFVQSRLLF